MVWLVEWSSVVCALIGGLVTFAGVIVANSRTTAVMEERIRALTREVERHNSVVERVYKLESDMSTAWKRHDELTDRVGRLEENR